VETSWNNIHRGGIPRRKWASRPERGGDTG
jgi:hypothetical protein